MDLWDKAMDLYADFSGYTRDRPRQERIVLDCDISAGEAGASVSSPDNRNRADGVVGVGCQPKCDRAASGHTHGRVLNRDLREAVAFLTLTNLLVITFCT